MTKGDRNAQREGGGGQEVDWIPQEGTLTVRVVFAGEQHVDLLAGAGA